MKFLVIIAAVLVCQAIAAPTENEHIREGRSYGAAPAYAAPAYAAPLGPAKSYAYASPAPTIPCGQAVVMSCAPSVAQAPCAASAGYGGSYGGSSY